MEQLANLVHDVGEDILTPQSTLVLEPELKLFSRLFFYFLTIFRVGGQSTDVHCVDYSGAISK